MSGSQPSYSLREIAERFGGEIVGDPQVRVSHVATLENAGSEAIAFLANPRYLRQVAGSKAAAVIVAPAARDATASPRIVHENPYLYFARVSSLLSPRRKAIPGIHPTAVVAEDASIAATAEIGPFAVIGSAAHVGEGAMIGAGTSVGDSVRIGRDAHLNPSVTIYAGCTLGERVLVHSGVVIGADGFGIAFADDH